MTAQDVRWGIASASSKQSAMAVRLADLAPLAPTELRLLETMADAARSLPARAELLVAGTVQPPQILASGWACYHRLLGDGRRQIVSFVLPGDAIGSVLNSGLPPGCSVASLTSVAVADARPLIAAAESELDHPGLAHLIRVMAAREEQGLRDQIVRLGRQTAYERMLHLILDFHDRLMAAGLCNRASFTLPLTQETLADALGLSVVHVNRTLQQIRRDGLLELRGGVITLLQPEQMALTADWRAPPASASEPGRSYPVHGRA